MLGATYITFWLGEGESRLPAYATHQVGVAGSWMKEDEGPSGTENARLRLLGLQRVNSDPTGFVIYIT